MGPVGADGADRVRGAVLQIPHVGGVPGSPPSASRCSAHRSQAQDDQTPARSLVDIRARAEAGDAEAQKNLGVMYAIGEGMPQDDAEAVAWFRKAAEQGHAEA